MAIETELEKADGFLKPVLRKGVFCVIRICAAGADAYSQSVFPRLQGHLSLIG